MRPDCSAPPEVVLPAVRDGEAPLAQRAARAAAFLLHALVVWLGARTACPHLSPRVRRRLVARLAAQTLAILGIGVVRRGAAPYRGGPCLLVANHVSWLDVHVLTADEGARYVAKAEVRRWPLVGGIARGFETFFIVRGSPRDARRVKDAVAAALSAGQRVVVFPEGTTTTGESVGRFYGALFQAAIDATAPVQPVAIRYRRPDGGRDDAAAFVGDTTFLASLRNVLRRAGMTAELTYGPAIRPHGLGRRDLVEATHRFVRLVLADAWEARPRPVGVRRAA